MLLLKYKTIKSYLYSLTILPKAKNLRMNAYMIYKVQVVGLNN